MSNKGNFYRKSNDPYNGMKVHQTRPDNIQAQDSLKAAESTAVKKTSQASAKKAEQSVASSHIKNSVKGLPASESAKTGKSGKKGFFKGKGPLTAILLMVFGGGALFFSGQSLLGAHISELYTQATDVQYTSYSLRNQRLFKFMLDGGDQIRTTAFSKKFTTFTPYMKSRLAKNGIEVGHLNSTGDFVSGDLLSGSSRVLRYDGDIINASDFQARYLNDVDFRNSYYKAKRGRVAGFFDDASDALYRKLGITRNIFDDYTASSESKPFAEAMEPLESRLSGAETDLNTAAYQTDNNGTPDDPSDDVTKLAKNGDDINPSSTPGDTPTTKARSFATSIASKVSQAGGIACTALRVANLANIAAFATSTANSVNYFMGIMENISKMMAGEGDASAINDVLNFFTTPGTSEITYTDNSGNEVTQTLEGSPLESNGARVVLGGVTSREYQAGAYSLESITNSAKRTVVLSGASSITCSGVMAASAIVSLVTYAVPGGAIAKVVIGMLAETVGAIAITGILGAVISAIVPGIARTLFTNVLQDYTGVTAGELFSQGAAAANFGVAKSSSAYMPASEAQLSAQARATSVVLAQEAELDRLNRSPFDITSRNTFLGSIVSSFTPLLTSSSATTPISTIANLTTNAISNILPGVSAADAGISYATTYGDCPALEEIGVKGDIYCNAIPAADLSTIDIEPDDPVYETVITRNLESDGVTVKDNSELAKFINFCTNRESPFGVTDANILNSLQTDGGIILNSLPILNDVLDIVNAAEDVANQDWATGAVCVNSSNNSRWDSEFKYFQRYVEDTRILDQMGAYEDSKSPILAYQEKYYAENPLDNSREGYLARITGMTTEDVAFLFEFADYYNFLAEYDPSNLYPVVSSPAQEEAILSFSMENLWPEQGIAVNFILYSTSRNRNFAA